MGDYQDRLDMIERNVPQLFLRPGRVLYIGARKERSDYIEELHAAGHEITVVEAFRKNYEDLIFDNRIAWLFHIDVRDIGNLFGKNTFDFTIHWHGPEHLRHSEVPAVLEELEFITRDTVVLGTPLGAVEQGVAYQNPYERHLSYWFPANFWGYGYKTDAIGTSGQLGSCILAWKEIP